MQQNIASLEQAQLGHNRAITAVSNNSASGDPSQHQHDLNSKLIKSAEAIAAGKTLGMSEEETLAAMSRMLRRQQRADDTVTSNDIARQLVQSAASIREVSPGAELKGVSLREEPELDPFGQDQGQYYEYNPNDSQYNEQKISQMQESMEEMEDRSGGGRRFDKGGNVVLKSGVDPNEYDELGLEVDRLTEPREREPVAPRSVLEDALGQLKAAKEQQSGFRGALSRVFGDGGLAATEGNLELALDPKIERAAQASLVEGMAAKDRDNMNYRRAAYNNIMGQIEAEAIGETMYRPSSVFPGVQLPSVKADRALASIDRSNRAFPLAGFNQEGIAFDPGTGNPIGMQGPEYVTPNTDSGAALNAPMTTRAWMVENQPGYREGGRVFGDYPQTDVTGATTLFANRLRGVKGKDKDESLIFKNISPSIRGIDELQRATDVAIRKAGIKFQTREPVTDEYGKTTLKSTKQKNPDIRGLLNALRYTPAQESGLANALYQLEAAKATTVNQQGKQQFFTRTGPNGSLEPTMFGEGYGPRRTGSRPYFPKAQEALTPGMGKVYFNAPEAIDPRDGQAPVARINPGQTIEGRDIVSVFKELDHPDAAKPFIGAVAVTDPKTGKTGIEKNAGPGYLTRYNRAGLVQGPGGNVIQKTATSPADIAAALTELQDIYQSKVGVGTPDGQPIDKEALKKKIVKATLTQERANRDAKKRQEKERVISQYTLANPNNVGRVARRFG